MKYMTSGDIHRMFKQEDEGTIIRRNNVRRIALENGIKNTLTQNIILIDSKDFFEKVNPYDLQAHEYKIPKLRCIKDCAREWNKHRKTGDRFIHADEIRDFLKTDTRVGVIRICKCRAFKLCNYLGLRENTDSIHEYQELSEFF